jgi:hypothetical protein
MSNAIVASGKDLYLSALQDADVVMEGYTPREIRAYQHERAAQALLTTHGKLEEALWWTIREMHQDHLYTELGFDSLKEWARTRLNGLASQDTLDRICNGIVNLISPLDAQPVLVEKTGQQINGSVLLEKASLSSLMKVAYMWKDINEPEIQQQFLETLLTGTSDSSSIRGIVKKNTDPDERIVVYFKELADREPACSVYIPRMTPAQERIFLSRLGNLVEIHQGTPS